MSSLMSKFYKKYDDDDYQTDMYIYKEKERKRENLSLTQ